MVDGGADVVELELLELGKTAVVLVVVGVTVVLTVAEDEVVTICVLF